MRIKCLVIDDDPLITDLLQHFCSKVEQIEYCIICNNPMDGLQLLTNQDFDLLFLDYNMPALDGKGILELKQDGSRVIMVTSRTDFAVESYNYDQIVDYLVKPIKFDRFVKAINKFTDLLSQDRIEEKRDHFFVKDGSRWIRIPYRDLLFVQSVSNYATLVLKESKVMSLINLKDLVKKLPDNFKRVHRSYIVNLDKVDFYTKDEVGIGGESIPIGHSYKKAIQELLDRDL